MKNRPLLVFLVVFLSGCYSTEHFHSKDTVQVKDQQITETMQQLSDEVRSISELLANEHKNLDTRNKLTSHLENMLVLSEKLGAGKFILNHGVLENNIHQLRADLQTARDALLMSSPSYYWVERIPQYCSNCHAFESG